MKFKISWKTLGNPSLPILPPLKGAPLFCTGLTRQLNTQLLQMWGRSHPFFSFTLGRAILPNDAGMPSSRWGWSKTNLALQECRHSPGQWELSFFFFFFLFGRMRQNEFSRVGRQ